LTSTINALGTAAATLKLVVPSPSGSSQPPVAETEVYTNVNPAIDAIGAEYSPNGDPTDPDLAAKFDDLRDLYAQMIGHCRQLLQNVENRP